MATTTSRLESGRPIQYTSDYRTNDGRAQTRDGNEASGRQANMDQIRIRGGRPLQGSIEIGGAKNAALPLMTTCLLTDGTLTLSRVPDLADINTLAQLLEHHGVEIEMSEDRPGEGHYGRIAAMTAKTISDTTAPYELVRRMRASILVLGPIVAREGNAKVSLPGGCAIGARPVDLHLKGLQHLGAEIELEGGYVHAKAPKGLSGGKYVFPKISVGASENLLMAARPGQGRVGPGKRRARAGSDRSGQLPGAHGRADRRHRDQHADNPGRRHAERHRARGHRRPHRDRDLRDGGGDHRRRGRAVGRRGPISLGQ